MSGHRPESPHDQIVEPSRLEARVVRPGPSPMVMGYDLEADLARHYRFLDLVGLLLGGQLAPPETARALEIALFFLAPASVADAPGHVGLLSRVCGNRFAATLGLAALALAEEAAFLLEEHAEWLAWLSRAAEGRPIEAAPSQYLARTPEELASVERLRALLTAIPFAVPALEMRPTRTASLLAVLTRCGLRREAIQTAWVLARLPSVAAEAAARPLLNVRDYPFNLPPLEYEEEEEP